MKLKIFNIVLAAIFLFIAIGFAIFYSIPRITYRYVKEYDAYEVSKVYGFSSSYLIENTYNGKPVIGIGEKAFRYHHNLEEVIFYDDSNIRYIETNAFLDCNNLNEVYLPNSLEIIRNNAFLNSGVTSIYTTSDSNLRIIEGSAFFGCTRLTNIILPEGLEEIGDYAFFDTALVELKLSKDTKLYDHSLVGVDEDVIKFY